MNSSQGWMVGLFLFILLTGGSSLSRADSVNETDGNRKTGDNWTLILAGEHGRVFARNFDFEFWNYEKPALLGKLGAYGVEMTVPKSFQKKQDGDSADTHADPPTWKKWESISSRLNDEMAPNHGIWIVPRDYGYLIESAESRFSVVAPEGKKQQIVGVVMYSKNDENYVYFGIARSDGELIDPRSREFFDVVTSLKLESIDHDERPPRQIRRIEPR